MIDKLPSIHSKINQLSPEDKTKNNVKRESDKKEGQPRGDEDGDKEKDQKRKESKTTARQEASYVSFDLNKVIEFLNADEYYKSKGMSFALSESHDAKLVFVKDSNDEIIQRLELSQANVLFERLKSKKNKERPIKGGILNING